MAAERFLVRYEEAMRAVPQHPEICRVRSSGWRQLPIPRSSYALFFGEAPDFCLVAAVLSTVQDPDMIQAQLLTREIGEG